MFTYMSRRWFWALMVASLGILGGCSRSANPLSDPGKAKPDDRLIGVWRFAGENGVSHFLISKSDAPNASPGQMDLVSVSPDDVFLIRPSHSVFFVSHIGECSYMNFPHSSKDEQKQKYYGFWRYAIADDQLTVWMKLNDKVIVSAIEKGELKGVIRDKNGHPFADITDTTDNLSAFISNTDPKLLFDDGWKVSFKRAK